MLLFMFVSIVVKFTSVTSGTGAGRTFGKTGAPACVGDRLTLICRSPLRSVVFPADNQKDIVEVPESVQSNMTLVPVSAVDEVFRYAFVGVAERIAELEARMAAGGKASAKAKKKRKHKRNNSKKKNRRPEPVLRQKAARERSPRNHRGGR